MGLLYPQHVLLLLFHRMLGNIDLGRKPGLLGQYRHRVILSEVLICNRKCLQVKFDCFFRFAQMLKLNRHVVVGCGLQFDQPLLMIQHLRIVLE